MFWGYCSLVLVVSFMRHSNNLLIIFLYRVPNRFSVCGKYDIFGHSHHYWHVCVVLAIMTIYIGCLENYFTRK
jgi:predicted membrane channel-forming protein YqfA (hemolysin III family)